MARCSADPARLLVRALGATLSDGLARAAPQQRAALTRAARLAGLPPAAVRGAGHPAAGPLERWKAGHRLFFTLNQLAVVAIRQARSGPCRFTTTAAVAHVLRAGAAAMVLTASFDSEAYQRTVRPAMAPPDLAVEGFSGLWSADHRALTAELAGWGRHHTDTCRPDCPAHRTLLTALDETGAAHHGVCARFVGRRSSLAGSEDSLRVLERLHRTRLRAAAGNPPEEN